MTRILEDVSFSRTGGLAAGFGFCKQEAFWGLFQACSRSLSKRSQQCHREPVSS